MNLIWKLTGTPEQQAVAAGAMEKIKFPWSRLRLPGVPELGWRNLNDGRTIRLHEEHPGTPLVGGIEGRRFILGVFYPGTGDIYLDIALNREQAEATIAAEIAHAVDEFLPLTDAQRDALMKALHGGGVDHHTWWEKVSYSAEYWSLVGETFMALFCKAYSDIPFGNTASFVHDPALVPAAEVRRIVGIERTDAVPVVVPPVVKFKHFAGSRRVHVLSHYPTRPGITIVGDIPAGFTRCRTCKPGSAT